MKYILALTLLTSFTLPLAAETLDTSLEAQPLAPATDIPRWSLEAGVGGLWLFGHGRVAYRLPANDNRYGMFLEYTPLEAEYDLFPGRFHSVMAGVRFYADPLGPFQLYLALGGGISFNPTSTPHPTDPTRQAGSLFPLFAYLGLGLDYMFHPNWGLNTQIGTILGLPRAELNLKYVF